MPKSKDIKVTVKVESKDLAKLYETIDDLRRRVEALEARQTTVYGPLTVTCGTSHQAAMDAISKAKLQSRGVQHVR